MTENLDWNYTLPESFDIEDHAYNISLIINSEVSDLFVYVEETQMIQFIEPSEDPWKLTFRNGTYESLIKLKDEFGKAAYYPIAFTIDYAVENLAMLELEQF